MILKIVFALQLNCGIQQAGNSVLSYGTLVYSEAGQESPQLAYFEKLGNEFVENDMCNRLKIKMNSAEHFSIRLAADRKKIIEVF